MLAIIQPQVRGSRTYTEKCFLPSFFFFLNDRPPPEFPPFPPPPPLPFSPCPGRGGKVRALRPLPDNGARPRGGQRRALPLNADDRARVRPLLPASRRYAIVHPGARLAVRR